MSTTGSATNATNASSAISRRRKAALLEGAPLYTARREEVIQVASRLFREKGYEATTLNDVAAALDTDRASLYYYVGSKDELLHEIVRRVLGKDLEMAERVRAKPVSSREKIEEIIAEMIASFDENYPHIFVYIEDMGRIARLDDEWSRDVIHSTKRFEELVVGILEEGQHDGSLRSEAPSLLTAWALFGMINWCHRWYHPGGRHAPSEVAAAFTSIFLNGAGQRPVYASVDGRSAAD